MKKIYAYLNGGLGNQMFQYAAARALALRTGAELILDTWSGFVRDAQYQRHYELNGLPIVASVATPGQRLPIWLYRVHQRLGGNIGGIIQSRWYGQFLIETKIAYLEEVNRAIVNSATWMVGYWQSPLYFSNYEDKLRIELMPPVPKQEKFLKIGRQLQQTESVALGIRLYEESANPEAHAREGRVKSTADIRAAIFRLRAQSPRARFFVFCTHRSPLLAQLQLPEDAIYLTHDEGYEGTLERLWLLSQCRHHIFTNSSYYWWGAWLSADVYKKNNVLQRVIAADNFINPDGLCEEWDRF